MNWFTNRTRIAALEERLEALNRGLMGLSHQLREADRTIAAQRALLADIAAQETATANATVRRMAAMARGAK